MKKILLGILYLFLLSFIFLFPQNILAETDSLKLQLQIPLGNLSEITISDTTIGDYIKALFTFSSSVVVVLAIVMIIVGGIRWIISGGDSGKIGQAKSTIIKALLGLFISLFAIFVLQIVSPGTITFQPITPPEQITAQYCCKYTKDGKEVTEFKTQTECKSITGGGTLVDTNLCQGSITAFNTADYCNGRDATASCYTNTCGTGDATGTISSSGICQDSTKPNCCKISGPLKNCDATNFKTVCTSAQYCASKSGEAGSCLPKRSNGISCQEVIIGSTSGTFLGGGANEVCLSNRCSGLTAAGTNKCIPQNGTGLDNDYCEDSSQCKAGSFCACEGFRIGIDSVGNDCKSGRCTIKIPTGDQTTICEQWVTNSSTDNEACASGACPFFVGKDTCQP